MPKQLDPSETIGASLLKQAIKELKIDVPILAYQVRGDQLELVLLGGKVVKYDLTPSPFPIPQKQSRSGKGRKKGKQ